MAKITKTYKDILTFRSQNTCYDCRFQREKNLGCGDYEYICDFHDAVLGCCDDTICDDWAAEIKK